ncbi:LuxR C-terminal-related transcriptional regulator [Rhodococcus olei]|uniref:LuxR C-terminal-related transcriptional regulator n=1 Tax=Rhodococcus olei TaxID=2161675 RepID=A0ABP8P717_9NOCA
MNLHWPVIERPAETAAIARAVGSADGPRGVVVDGLAGTGKTTLLKESTARSSRPVTWVAGTTAAQHTPFGALSEHLGPRSPWDLTSRLSDTRRALTEHLPNGTVVVDDAHLLDPLSATLLNQLATSSTLALVVSTRTGEPVPDAVTALWKDRGFVRVTVRDFEHAESDAALAAALGGPVESLTAERIWTETQGNPLYLRHLVEGSHAAGRLRCRNGIWQLRGEPAITLELALLLHTRCRRAPPPARRVVELVAFGEPLALPVLSELAGEEAMIAAERAELVRFSREGSMLAARLAHPFLGEVVRKSVDERTARQIRGEIAALLRSHPGRPADRIRAAELSLDSDRRVSADTLTVAAEEAAALGAFPRAENLARAATAEGDGVTARLIHARALAWTDRGADAERLLSAPDPTALPEADRLTLVIARAANLFWNLDAGPESLELLRLERSRRATDRAARDCLDAVRAAIDVSLGNADDGLRTALRVRRSVSAPPAARVWAASAGALALAMTGHGHAAPAWADGALGLIRSDTAGLRFSLGQGEILALVHSGQFDRADRSARRYLTMAADNPAAWFGISALIGRLDLAKGDVPAAQARLAEAAAGLERSNVGWRGIANLALAQAFAVSGRTPEATAAVRVAEAAIGEHRLLYRPDLDISRAWAAASGRNTSAAIEFARRAASLAHTSGLLAAEAEALHAAVRFGDTAGAPRLLSLADLIDGRLVQPMARQATALSSADGDELVHAAGQFDGLGARLLAADAYAQAADAYRHAGDRRRELRSAAHAHALADGCGHARTPALVTAARALPLTDRERQMALLAAADLTNHQIADRLGVSPRTVEGHMSHVMMKLQARDRADMIRTVLIENGA